MRHLESQIQIACVTWFRYAYPDLRPNLISIPNGYKTSLSQAKIAKAEGMVAGASDLFLFFPASGFHGLAIEMKTPKGEQQPSQKAWQRAIEASGYKYTICRSFDDFKETIRDYLHKR